MITFFIGGFIMLGVSIFVHELGHFLLGRAMGIRVKTFSIGYGRGVWKKEVGETTYQITAIPFGGYVRFYGDDFTSEEKEPGGFLSAPPLKRIIPVLGGPLFNLILGFLLFILMHSLSGPLAPKITIWEEQAAASPAYKAGLRNGDTVLSINGNPVADFFEIKQLTALSAGSELNFEVKRGNEVHNFKVTPEVDPSGVAFVGIRPPGKRYLEVNYPTDVLWGYRFLSLFQKELAPRGIRAMPFLEEGDVLLKVEGEVPGSVYQLQDILGKHHGKEVTVTVQRQSMPWLTPWVTEEKTLKIPSTGEYKILLKEIYDLKYNEKLPDQEFISSVDEHQRGLADMTFNGVPAGSFQKMWERFNDAREVKLKIKDREYHAIVQVKKIGVFGFRARDFFESEYLPRPAGIGSVFKESFRDTWASIMVYPEFFKNLFAGRMSFLENARGPVGMFAIAGVVFKSGFREYLQLFAAISIALMVMNLLPIPVVDGGHIMFFLYEAITGRPLPARVMEIIYRFSFSLLLMLGIFIMYRDILFFIGL